MKKPNPITTTADKAPRRQRRTKANIQECLLQAAEQEIGQQGFSTALVTNIIKRAKIEPQVFYNRYKDLNEFYDSFVKKYDYWINDLMKQTEAPLVTRSGLSEFINKLITSLEQDPVLLELLRWELSAKNQITMRTSAMRELCLLPLSRGITRKFKNSHINPNDVLALLAGGIYYAALHGKVGAFHGVDFYSEDGRQRIEEAVANIIELMYASVDEVEAREREIADRLRASGVSEEVIARALA